jgi:outer membrane lipoprotein-sorting protein
MRKLMLRGAAAALFCSCAAGQDAAEILRKSAEAVRSLTSYDIELTQTYDNRTRETTSRSASRERLAASGNKSRREETGGRITVSDGESMWSYVPGRGEYIKQRFSGMQGTVLWAPYCARDAKMLREESVPIGERQVPSWVIELASPDPLAQANRMDGCQPGPATVWIDKSTLLPVKQSKDTSMNAPGQPLREITSTLAITKAAFNQPLADSLFRPDLPADAAEVKQLGFGTRSPLMGRSLPAIEGTDLRGNPVSPAAWKDKWLLLRFGDTSVSYDMSFCELLYRAFKGGKVAVLNVVTGRPADAGGQLARLGYTLPSMLAPDTMTPASMGFTGNTLRGIVLADSAGKVVYHTNDVMSSGTPDAIVKALMAAGVW